jgi:spermidine/putrescine transport system permease protein
VSSRLFVFLIPIVVIAIFWVMAKSEKKLAHDPTHKSFFERNGTVLGISFIMLVGFWSLFLVVLPYLYMVVESFHPKLPPAQRGGPDDVLTIAQYKSFFISPVNNELNTTHLYAFGFTIVTSVLVTALNFAICYPLAYYIRWPTTWRRQGRRRRCASSCWR